MTSLAYESSPSARTNGYFFAQMSIFGNFPLQLVLFVILSACLFWKLNRLIVWHDYCVDMQETRLPRINDMKNTEEIVDRSHLASFDDVTEEDIILLWQSYKSSGLSEDDAWNAIMAGIALDMAFARTRKLATIEQ